MEYAAREWTRCAVAELGELTGVQLSQADAQAAARPPRVGWKAAVAGRALDVALLVAQAHAQLWAATALDELRSLIEEDAGELEHDRDGATLDITPFSIETVKLTPELAN